MNKKVTIQDIADALGISRNTVSKAINNSEGIADSTKDKILAKAVEMGYKQFSYVSAMAGIKAAADVSMTDNTQEIKGEIGLLTTSYIPVSHFASPMMDRLQRELSQLSLHLSTYIVSEENIRSLTLPPALDVSQVKGLICIEMFNPDYCDMLTSTGVPVLFVDAPCRDGERIAGSDILLMDNMSEISTFVKTMIGRGLTRIGFIGDYRHCESFYERYCAFRMAMINAGVPVEEKFLLLEKDRDLDSLGSRLESLDEMPDVFICVNDFVAIEAMLILRRKDSTLLDKVRFLGFDDSHESRIFYPSLSTVHIHTQSMAFSALHLLMTRIKEPDIESRTVYVETNLILRDSTEF